MEFRGRKLTTVWVDLDDTLIDFTTNAHSALCRMWADEPLLQRLFDSAEVWARRYEEYNMALWAEYNVGRISREFLRMERFRRPLAEAGLGDAQAREVSARYDVLYLDYLSTEKAQMPGAMRLLERLRKCGVRIGCLSNGFKEVQYRKMHAAGLDGKIDLTVLSDDIGVNKPDRRIFDYAMQRSGDADPEHHLMIGDNPETDIGGALAAGWGAVWYHPGRAYRGVACPAGAVEVGSLDDICSDAGAGCIY